VSPHYSSLATSGTQIENAYLLVIETRQILMLLYVPFRCQTLQARSGKVSYVLSLVIRLYFAVHTLLLNSYVSYVVIY
jgi:hypothetical protein